MKLKLKWKNPVYIVTAFFVILLVVILVLTACAQSEKREYLCLHIRANSNSQADQDVKYEVRDAVINYLTPLLDDVTDLDYALKVVEENLYMAFLGCFTIILGIAVTVMSFAFAGRSPVTVKKSFRYLHSYCRNRYSSC